MNSTHLKTRMGKRLSTLFQQIPQNTTTFWDLCCDHGALGRAVIESKLGTRVDFNDIHPGIMLNLEQTLTRLGAEHYELKICPAEQTLLSTTPHPTIMLAGIGDEQSIKILKALFAQEASQNALFIISPATKNYNVRRFLAEHGVYHIEELAVTENKRTYEIISISLQPSDEATKMRPDNEFLFGQCWQPGNSDHIRHIKKILKFYLAQSINSNQPDINAVVNGYQNILKKIEQ